MDKQLPPLKNNNNPDAGDLGEAQITPDVARQVAPEALSTQGLADLAQKQDDAHKAQGVLNAVLDQVAGKLNAKSENRVKSPNVIIQKIGQKRLEGDNKYGLDDINDMWGGRLIIDKPSDEKKTIDALQSLADKGIFKILGKQPIEKDNYHAYHLDIEYALPDGHKVNGEIQIHTPQSVAQAAVTHDARYIFGENLPDPAQKVMDQETKVVKKLPNDKAQKLADSIVKKRKANGDTPLPPITVAQEIKKAGMGGKSIN